MKATWFVVTVLALAAHAQGASVADPIVQVDFSNPGLSPSQWTMTFHRNGTGHFRSQMGKPPDGGLHVIDTPSIDRDFTVSQAFSKQIFETAERHKWFNETCESHMKVAFQGWKTLTYTGPRGQGACTFNYSKDREIEDLGESMQAVAQTLLEGARLELLLQHDRLGLDAEMEFLSDAAEDGRAQQLIAIREILQRLADDDAVLERVRKRARALLEHATT